MTDEITFQSVTPIFRFELDPSDAEFLHCGRFRSAEYAISLRKYEQGQAGFDELMKYADEYSRRALASIHIHRSCGATDYFLVVDATQPLADDLKVAENSSESVHIASTILKSLQLHSSMGVLCHESYHFRSPFHPYSESVRGRVPPYKKGSHIATAPLVGQYLFPHLGVMSVLPDSEFASCRATFDSLVAKQWNDSITFDKVLQLALAYHRIAFNLEAVQHSFLILMIVFEALFKKESDPNAGRAAKRISKLVSTAQSDRKAIQSEFFSNNPDAFCRLRNRIAHGDPALDSDDVKSRYPALYHYITKAIIELISIPDGELDDTKDYYEEVSRFIDNRFNGLPA